MAKRAKTATGSGLGILPSGYAPFLEDLKQRIRATQVKASLAANREVICLYWHIGKSIVERQRNEGWGKAVVERLAADLQSEFPGMKGFSSVNIWRMRSFYLACNEDITKLSQPVTEMGQAILAQVVTEIPWGHNILLIQQVKDRETRLWYARQTIENGWSRAMLRQQIESGLHKRQGKATSNFALTLPSPQSDLVQQTIKDPYIFDFLPLAADAVERDLERGLTGQIRKFLVELGVGFAFVGNQYHLEVDGEDFYIDLLFYHLRLRAFVVIDLKMDNFKPEFAGKMNFYLAAVDAKLRHAQDNPSIGLILCKTQKKLIAEYSLRNTKTPIGVSEYKLTRTIPAALKANLPSIAQLEKELADPALKSAADQHKKKNTDYELLKWEIWQLREDLRVWVALGYPQAKIYFGTSAYLPERLQRSLFHGILMNIRRLTDLGWKDEEHISTLYWALREKGQVDAAENLVADKDIKSVRILADNVLAHNKSNAALNSELKKNGIETVNRQNQGIFKAVALLSNLYRKYIDHQVDIINMYEDGFIHRVKADGVPFIDYPIEETLGSDVARIAEGLEKDRK